VILFYPDHKVFFGFFFDIINFFKSFFIDGICVKLFINEHFVEKKILLKILCIDCKIKEEYILGPIKTLFGRDIWALIM
jgi:hypothetical protein